MPTKNLLALIFGLIAPAQLLAQIPDIQQLLAVEIARYPAAEARQGAAADKDHFYAVVNTAIGKYRKRDGELVAQFQRPRNGLIRHLNSCYAESGSLYCANSNFPEIPMASSIEVFATENLSHSYSYSLGVLEEGSLTWFDRLGDGWIAGFAHYDEGRRPELQGSHFRLNHSLRCRVATARWLDDTGFGYSKNATLRSVRRCTR